MSELESLEFKLTLERYKPFLFPMVFLLFFVISFGRVVMPRIGQIGEEVTELKEKRAELERLDEKLSLLKSLDEKELQDDTNLLLQALPVHKDPFYGLSVIDWLGQESEVTVRGVSFVPGQVGTESAVPVKKAKEQEPSVYEVKLSGTLSGLRRFFTLLEDVCPVAQVDGARLNFSQDSDKIETGIELTIYNAVFPESIGKPSDILTGFSPGDKEFLDALRENSIFPESDRDILTQDPIGKDNLFD